MKIIAQMYRWLRSRDVVSRWLRKPCVTSPAESM
jgi:hypothetical protein